LRVSTVLTFLLTEQIVLAYVLIPELRDRFWTLFAFFAIIAVCCLTTSTVGLLCSSLARRTSAAMVLTYMVLLVLFVVPVGLGQFLKNFSELNESDLAALTVTSPYSASFSIPLPPISNWTTTDREIGPPPPRIPGLNLPVWAAYLLLNPLLCLGFVGLTYLAFRYRWWRAAATI
jgi:hypothetical protein